MVSGNNNTLSSKNKHYLNNRNNNPKYIANYNPHLNNNNTLSGAPKSDFKRSSNLTKDTTKKKRNCSVYFP